MGGSILGTPAIFMFRKSFPGARIDFVGSAISKALFDGLPIDHYYEAERHFPKVCWSYIALLRQIRAVGYDLAVDVSGSSAALGSFIVGFSGARFRAGLRGKWDHWFNARFARPTDKNKYGSLPELLRSMGLEEKHTLPTLTLSANEKKAGKTRLTRVVGCADSLVIGIFVGGRKTRGKRWDSGKFVE